MSRCGVEICLLVVLCLAAGCKTTQDGRPAAPSSRRAPSAAGLSSERRDAQARILFVRGMASQNWKDHETAIMFFQGSLRLKPDEPAVLAALSESLAESGDLKSALFYAEQASRIAPANTHYRKVLADLHLKAGDPRTAEQTYQSLLARSPGNPEALRELARIQTASGQYADAVETYQELIARIGRDPLVLNQVLDLYSRLADDLGMEQTLRDLIQVESAETQYHRALSDIFVRQDRFREAALVLEQALETGSESYENALALAEVYRAMGRYADADSLLAREGSLAGTTSDLQVRRAATVAAQAGTDSTAVDSALQQLETILTRDPDNIEAQRLMGELLVRHSQPERAADYFYRVLVAEPRDPDLWTRTSDLYLEGGNARRAGEVVEEALTLFPGDPELLTSGGLAYMALFENERASGRLREALAILEEDNPAGNREQRARAWSALGELYRRLQSYPASDNAFAESLALDPDDAITLSRFAFSLAERGIRLADALQYARRAANARPQDPSILDTVGWVYYRSGDDRNARSWLTRAVETGRAGPTAYEHLGDVLWRTGEKEGARQNWQRALEMNPSSDRLMQKLRSGS